MELNKIYNEDCISTMRRMDDCFIDLTITSPPYDNLRDYNGYTFNFENIFNTKSYCYFSKDTTHITS